MDTGAETDSAIRPSTSSTIDSHSEIKNETYIDSRLKRLYKDMDKTLKQSFRILRRSKSNAAGQKTRAESSTSANANEYDNNFVVNVSSGNHDEENVRICPKQPIYNDEQNDTSDYLNSSSTSSSVNNQTETNDYVELCPNQSINSSTKITTNNHDN